VDSGQQTNREIELGTAGASARVRYEAQRWHDEERWRRILGPFAFLAGLFAGPRLATEAWRLGATGEERIGADLTRCVGSDGIVLHDRAVEGSTANLDHIAIVPSGVWVIDAKYSRHRPEQRRAGGIFVGRRTLVLGGQDRSVLIRSAIRQRDRVSDVVGDRAPVRAALCFSCPGLSVLARPFSINGVRVTWSRAFRHDLRHRGPLDGDARRFLAADLARAFPPYPIPPQRSANSTSRREIPNKKRMASR
jgi:Nuclease-related domain